MCTGRWDIWIPPPVTRVRIEVFNAGESHANSTAYGGIFRDHATPTSTHGAQEGRFSGALYPEYPTRFSYLPIIAVAAKAMPGDKDCRTPWRHSLGGVDLWRRLNANSYMVKLVHFARLRYALELLVRYWFSVVILPQRRSP